VTAGCEFEWAVEIILSAVTALATGPNSWMCADAMAPLTASLENGTVPLIAGLGAERNFGKETGW
jgi:hypothetical protein